MSWTVAILLFALVATVAADNNLESQEAVTQVVNSNNEFGKNLYQLLASSSSKSDNLIVSPFSAHAILTLCRYGAGGNTAEEMQTVLHLPDNSTVVREGFRAIFNTSEENEDMVLRTANRLYAKKGADVKEEFRNIALEDFGADAWELDFENEPEESRVAINKWVENVTENTIQNLLDKISSDTLMVLVNAIYFKGTWTYTFKETDTRNDTFYTSSDSQVIVPMMYLNKKLRSCELDEYQARALELPYKGNSMKMIVFLPNDIDGLPYLEERVGNLNITKITEEMEYKQTDLSLPKFKIEDTWNLDELLPEMGMSDLFTSNANLSEISDASLRVDKVTQKASMEVTESGTTAAATTSVVISLTSASISSNRTTFHCEHPFLFILAHNNKIMFIGRVVNPKS